VLLDQLAKGVVADLMAEALSRDIDLGFAVVDPVSLTVKRIVDDKADGSISKVELTPKIRLSRGCQIAGRYRGSQ
jgi:hypothetical protein